MTSRLFDISVRLAPGLLVWPGDPPVEMKKIADFRAGDAFEISRMALSTHAGTHVDPPAHFIPGGKTADQIDVKLCLGPVLVAALPGRRAIGPSDLAAYDWSRFHRVLLKTDNSHFGWQAPFQEDFVGLTPDAARFLVEQGVILVGIDYLSIEPEGDGRFPVHRILLTHEVLILEGIDLTNVLPGVYELVCLPLNIQNGDGAPARAILIRQ